MAIQSFNFVILIEIIELFFQASKEKVVSNILI